MNELVGASGELRGVVTITRKATGKTETYSIVGRVGASNPDQPVAPAAGDGSENKGE